MTNKIKVDCPACNGKEADVLAKIFSHGKTTIVVKCETCHRQNFLPENDKKCAKFFK